jgi:hypothetical protein
MSGKLLLREIDLLVPGGEQQTKKNLIRLLRYANNSINRKYFDGFKEWGEFRPMAADMVRQYQ